ncbi:hypothetical protein EHS25_009283 [Saitozyma podzolica]|uniref:Uncharacterized protein n=1 Tax=Saitozyma podzolica TaxID=1890683 RepID=A0A427YLE5_9TREE|nr:hypothetical protein EHS25_009283 [Saitozyma podzolica]
MSLNSVVNNLVRAAAGISTEISDADLDQHVAKLLADEAKAREVKWSELGLGAFLGGDRGSGRDSPDPSQPKPNKRFLASVIRTVDGHNSALLRAQAEAARSARQERGDDVTSSSGSSRRGGAGRLFGGAMKGLFSDRFEPEKGGSRDRDRERSSRGSRDGGRERDSERDWRRARGREGDYDYERDRERRREERLERDKSFAERRSRGWGEEDEEQYYNEGAEGSSYRPEPTGADNNDIGINDDGSGDDDGESRSRRRGKDGGTRAYRSRKREDEERDKMRSSRWREERGISRREWEEGKRDKRGERERERGSDSDRARVRDKERVRDRGDGRQQSRKRDRDREGEERRRGDDHSRSPSRSPPRRSKSSRESRRSASPPSGATPSNRRSTSTSPLQSPRRRARSPTPVLPVPPAEPPSPGPPPTDSPIHPAPARISKMDKYFQSSYDPRLDLGAVPKEGLVAEVGWDNMLAILKERGKKKRHQSPTLSDEAYGVPQGITLRSPSPSTEVLLSRKIDRTEKKRRKEERKRRTAGDWSDASEQERDREKRRRKKGEEKARDKALDPASGFTRKEEGMMEVEYVKKGGVREWDKGK